MSRHKKARSDVRASSSGFRSRLCGRVDLDPGGERAVVDAVQESPDQGDYRRVAGRGLVARGRELEVVRRFVLVERYDDRRKALELAVRVQRRERDYPGVDERPFSETSNDGRTSLIE